jgi:hypothetical protein
MSQRPKIRSLAKAKENREAKAGTLTATIAELENSIPALNALMVQPIPICTSHLINKIAAALNSEIEQYRNTVRKMGERLANKDAEGKPVILASVAATETEGEIPERFEISPENEAKGTKEMESLRGMIVDIPGKKINIRDLSSAALAPALESRLHWMISE